MTWSRDRVSVLEGLGQGPEGTRRVEVEVKMLPIYEIGKDAVEVRMDLSQ